MATLLTCTASETTYRDLKRISIILSKRRTTKAQPSLCTPQLSFFPYTLYGKNGFFHGGVNLFSFYGRRAVLPYKTQKCDLPRSRDRSPFHYNRCNIVCTRIRVGSVFFLHVCTFEQDVWSFSPFAQGRLAY